LSALTAEPRICYQCGNLPAMTSKYMCRDCHNWARRRINLRSTEVLDRIFWTRVKITPRGCWEYHGSRTKPDGYGYINRDGARWVASRYIWTLLKGPIPDGLLVLHDCDNKPCVNPSHLYVGTDHDNRVDYITRVGDARTQAKLTEAQVIQIRSLYPGLNYNRLAKQFGVSRGHVKNIIQRKVWSWVPD
jgi:hypothetical protein